jgi:anaerobic magnesium-protoporphyrin IX monomethyl ester cyclase
MTKVALIQPGKDPSCSIHEPLNLGFIASFLIKNGVDVRIIDELVGQDVKKSLEDFKPDIAGITATTPLANDAYRIAEMCKSMGILTVMGGVHATIMPDEALKHADIVVKGEGELAMMDIINKNIRSGIVSAPYIKNLDDVPMPARSLMDMDFYLGCKDRFPDGWLCWVPPHTKTASILTSRGCPNSCTFCHNSWKGLPIRFNSPERVIEEIKILVNDYKAKALFFIDDNLFFDKKRLAKICELMKENKIDIIWGAQSRVDNIDEDILGIAKDAGCKMVSFGFESGSQKTLDSLSKRTVVEQNKKAIEMCKKAGMPFFGYFIIGCPGETMEDAMMTKKFIEENDIEYCACGLMIPFPGTKIWDWCKEKGIVPKDFSDWDSFRSDKISFYANDTIPADELKKVFNDIQKMIMFKRLKKHPFKIFIETIRNPRDRIGKALRIAKGKYKR